MKKFPELKGFSNNEEKLINEKSVTPKKERRVDIKNEDCRKELFHIKHSVLEIVRKKTYLLR